MKIKWLKNSIPEELDFTDIVLYKLKSNTIKSVV